MQRAKVFFYVSAGICLLAAAYHLGATNAQAQAPGNPIVAAASGFVLTSNGDVYSPPGNASAVSVWVHAGNVFAGSGPTSAQQPTWGQLKAKYR